jgi:hypothetical protein
MSKINTKSIHSFGGNYEFWRELCIVIHLKALLLNGYVNNLKFIANAFLICFTIITYLEQ